MEKRNTDAEERKYQEAQKKVLIERAHRILFEKQDNVKSFSSSLLQSDCLKEREFQKEIKKRKEDIEHRIKDKWEQVEIEKMKDYDLKEIQKQEDEKTKKKGSNGNY